MLRRLLFIAYQKDGLTWDFIFRDPTLNITIMGPISKLINYLLHRCILLNEAKTTEEKSLIFLLPE